MPDARPVFQQSGEGFTYELHYDIDPAEGGIVCTVCGTDPRFEGLCEHIKADPIRPPVLLRVRHVLADEPPGYTREISLHSTEGESDANTE